ncbi:MAG: AAA family ATPase, partial [Microcystis panniformis]
IYLRRPLLLEGDAGCGKTRLASAVAYELGLPLYRWDVRSTTKAQDGLYEYDALLRLHDVHTREVEQPTPVDEAENEDDDEKNEERVNRNPSKPKHYRKFGALGKAFRLKNCPAIVLIDEIDKADLDFPNDLLAVLDEPWEFKIKETGETIRATYPSKDDGDSDTEADVIDCRPIVIITSNKEKGNLPAPFLRRCLYYYLDFPNDVKQLQEIVEKHYQIRKEAPPPKALVDNAIARFLAVWNEGGLFKKPGTSEFLDWLKALHTFESKPYSGAQLKKDNLLPYRELLFKLQQDWKKYAKAS